MPSLDMAPPVQKGFSRTCRRASKWALMGLVLLLIIGLISVVYLHRVGVPEFLKARVLADLRARGLDVQVGRVWLRGTELWASDLKVKAAPFDAGPEAFVQLAQFKVRPEALRKGRFQPERAALTGARLTWDAAATNSAVSESALEDVAGELL